MVVPSDQMPRGLSLPAVISPSRSSTAFQPPRVVTPRLMLTAYFLALVSSAVTVSVTLFRPAARFTWWPGAFLSASGGAMTSDAPAWLAVAVTVATVTVLATPTS